jgi:hypothetical protein
MIQVYWISRLLEPKQAPEHGNSEFSRAYRSPQPLEYCDRAVDLATYQELRRLIFNLAAAKPGDIDFPLGCWCVRQATTRHYQSCERLQAFFAINENEHLETKV